MMFREEGETKHVLEFCNVEHDFLHFNIWNLQKNLKDYMLTIHYQEGISFIWLKMNRTK